MATNNVKTLEAVTADGEVTVDTWVQAPTPSKAGPYKPSLVTWKRGMGTEEAQGIIEIATALRVVKPNFYVGRKAASLAVIRAHQVLHTEANIPTDVSDNFGGTVPDLKGVHYYSVTQIVKSGPDCTRMVEAVEEETQVPYVTQVAPFLTTQYSANNQTYGPSRATREALRNPAFVSATAALQARMSTVGVATGVAAVATPTTNDNKRARVDSTDEGTDGGARALFTTPGGTPGSAKVTDAANAAVDAYVKACKAANQKIDSKVLDQLYKTED